MLEHLRATALDLAPENRPTLLRQLAGCVFTGRSPTPPEIALFTDIALRLLPDSPEDVRQSVAEVIAGRAGLPQPLVVALVTDASAEVAAPILRLTPDISLDAQKNYAETLAPDRLAALAGRVPLDAAVVDILVRRGDIGILRRVVENLGSVLSPATVQRLVEEAAADDDLCRLLALRDDLGAEATDRVVMLVAKRLRDRMAGRARPTAPVETTTVRIAMPRRAAAPVDIATLIAAVGAGTTSLDEAVVLLADADRSNDLAALLSAQTGIDDLSVMKVLLRADANGIINVLRGLGVSATTWDSVVHLRQQRLKFSKAHARFEKEDFERLAVEAARATLAQVSHRKPA